MTSDVIRGDDGSKTEKAVVPKESTRDILAGLGAAAFVGGVGYLFLLAATLGGGV